MLVESTLVKTTLMETALMGNRISGVISVSNLNSLLLFQVSEPPRRKKLAHVNTLQDVVELIRNSKKIIILTGKKILALFDNFSASFTKSGF